ncbi:MAG TPA: MBL fold metallo-hydrolase, partial [Chloroflexota bacterium]|nr:MBL fold metallo-hydrolase [Chloroflexota bacterium]
GVLERLAALGVAPEEIEHVVITHAHGDHYNRLTVKRDGAYQLAFPNARCYLGASDWTSDYCQSELQKADSLDTRTLGVVHGAGRLVPVDGELNLAPNVSILPAPGETPGHQILRVRAGGQTLYCIGDLYHHPIEVIHPTWMSPWGNPTTNVRSRQSVAEAALADNALLVATHIRGVGRLERHDGGVRWVESP